MTDAGEQRPWRVDVVSDPGIATRAVRDVIAAADGGAAEGPYEMRHERRRIPLRDDGSLDLDEIRQWSTEDAADMLVIVTEIPRRAGARPKISALHFSERLAIISLPALGWIRVHAHLRRVLFDSVDALAAGTDPDIRAGRMRFGAVHEQASETGRSVYIDSPWWRPRRTALVLGMVRTNEPLAVVPKLSGVLTAATATGAFGVFYSSIWRMAAALPTWRLALIAVAAIVAMVVWLIVSNRLWERSRQHGSLVEATMYNASTVITLALAVTALYLSLTVAIFVTAIVVIEAGFMASVLGREVNLGTYAEIAWLSASMGTVAGALGSNFDSRDHITELTQGTRRAHRYAPRGEE
ncbi:hypothetical protein [Microbacterium sp. ZXX196]|uniref:hypothetical protein n=1 Tax=Microbacterium sp. ZXX196 TaxID=2609291 RepID=UPI001329358D|nr:hypothetical protein [Microbacterium sp. ZXX196]MTE23242.1 hypothetical protein [Microbacterium sp. ZXX196]